MRERLRRVWLDPMALDPAPVSARVTRDIAQRLADIARVLESAGHDPEAVAQFLTRCCPRSSPPCAPSTTGCATCACSTRPGRWRGAGRRFSKPGAIVRSCIRNS